MKSSTLPLLPAVLSAPGRLYKAPWCIEEGAFTHYVTQQREPMGHCQAPTAESLVQRQGSIAVIPVHGVLVPESFWDDEISTNTVGQAVSIAMSDDAIEGVLFDFDTPGGSASGIPELAAMIAELAAKKPTRSQSSGMCCSAGYFMACQTQEIYSRKSDVVGSIGTRMMVYDFSEFFANMGVKAHAIDSGRLKSTGAFGTPLTEEQRSYLQGLVNDLQTDFSAAVQKGRRYSAEQLAAVSSGAVYTAGQALRMGLIDGIQSFDKTLAAMPRRQSTISPRSKKAMSATATEQTAATLSELEKALPGASSEFVVAQLRVNATLGEATQNYNAHLLAENTRLKQEAATAAEAQQKQEAEAAAAQQAAAEKAAKATPAGRGNKLAQTAAGQPVEQDANPCDAWQAEIEKELARPSVKNREQAARNVNRRLPELREAVVAAANA